ERGRQPSGGVATTVQAPAAEVAATVPAGAAEGQEFLQVGAFASLASAQRLVARLSTVVSAPVAIHSDPAVDGAVLHKVRIGPLADASDAAELIETVQRAQLGTPFKIRI